MEKQREAARAALELEEQEELDRQLLDDGPTVPLPDVPRSVPRKPQAAEAKIEELYWARQVLKSVVQSVQ